MSKRVLNNRRVGTWGFCLIGSLVSGCQTFPPLPLPESAKLLKPFRDNVLPGSLVRGDQVVAPPAETQATMSGNATGFFSAVQSNSGSFLAEGTILNRVAGFLGIQASAISGIEFRDLQYSQVAALVDLELSVGTYIYKVWYATDIAVATSTSINTIGDLRAMASSESPGLLSNQQISPTDQAGEESIFTVGETEATLSFRQASSSFAVSLGGARRLCLAVQMVSLVSEEQEPISAHATTRVGDVVGLGDYDLIVKGTELGDGTVIFEIRDRASIRSKPDRWEAGVGNAWTRLRSGGEVGGGDNLFAIKDTVDWSPDETPRDEGFSGVKGGELRLTRQAYSIRTMEPDEYDYE